VSTEKWDISCHNPPVEVEALRYKTEGRGFDSRRDHWGFLLSKSFRPQFDPYVDSACNRNEYQRYVLGIKAAAA
jgi:hypothetical protein